MELSGYLLTKRGGSAVYKIRFFFVSGSPSFLQLWGGGIISDRYRASVLMSVGYRVRNLRGRHRYWQLVHHHRVGGVTNVELWVGIAADFGNQSIEAILSCRFPRTLNTI